MKKISSFLSFFLVLALVISSPAVQTFNFPEKLAPQSVLSDSSDPGPSSDGLSDSDRRSKSKPLTLRGRVRQQAVVVRELLIVGLAFILPLFVLGCMLSPTKENIFNSTKTIREKILEGEEGNYLRIVREIRERRDLIEESGLSRNELVGGDGLDLKGLASDIYLEFGVIVEGARKRDLLHIQDLLRILPPQHIEGFHEFVLNVQYDSAQKYKEGGHYYPIWKNIISFSPAFLKVGKGGIPTRHLGHEMGHRVHFEVEGFIDSLIFWWYHVVCSSNKEDYPSEYAQTNRWEDYAEIYEGWVDDTDSFIRDTRKSLFSLNPKSEVLIEKVLFVARQFLIERNGKYYIRVYENMNYQDILLDIEEPDDLEIFHLYELGDFMRKERETHENRDFLDIYYTHPHAFVDFVLSGVEGYEEELVARRLYRMLEKIKDDKDLRPDQKRTKAVRLVYRFLNANPKRSAGALEKFRSLRLRHGGILVEFHPEKLESLDELEAMWFIEPEVVENWLFQDTQKAMDVIRHLPYFESLDSPRSWPVLFLAIYDKVITHPNPTPEMLLQILISYCENQAYVSKKFSELVQLDSVLLFRFLAKWNPDFLREYLGPLKEKIKSQSENEVKKMDLVLIDEVNYVEKKAAPFKILLKGKYVAPEIVQLFKDDVNRAIEILFGSAKPQDKEDLKKNIELRTQRWIHSWKAEAFKPVLDELRRRYKGITIKEVIELVGIRKDGKESIGDEELLGIFIFLNRDIDNFIRHHGRWFLDFGKKKSANEDNLPSPRARNEVNLMKKINALFEVSPDAFGQLFNQLTEDEVSIFFFAIFNDSPNLKTYSYTETEVFADESLFELRMLERIYQLKGKQWLQEQIWKATRRVRENNFLNRLLAFLKGEISDDLRGLLESFLLSERNISLKVILGEEDKLRSQILRISQVLPKERLIRGLSEVAKQFKSEKNRKILETIIEEIRSGSFKVDAPAMDPSSQEIEEEKILEEWKKLRERWEKEKETQTSFRFREPHHEGPQGEFALISRESHLWEHSQGPLPVFYTPFFDRSL